MVAVQDEICSSSNFAGHHTAHVGGVHAGGSFFVAVCVCMGTDDLEYVTRDGLKGKTPVCAHLCIWRSTDTGERPQLPPANAKKKITHFAAGGSR